MLAVGCGESLERRDWNVLLITLDTTRADQLGPYGASIATPNLDELARQGVVFENAFTAIPSTLPSHCTIMTSQYPVEHGVHDNGIYYLEPAARTLAEQLQSAGYQTAAFVSAYVLDGRFGLDQGFSVYDDRVDKPLIAVAAEDLARSQDADQRRFLGHMGTAYERRAENVTRAAQDWLQSRGAEPFFLWVHYFDAHGPYQAPEPWQKRYDPGYSGVLDGSKKAFFSQYSAGKIGEADIGHMIARYQGEVTYMDEWIGHLLQTIRTQAEWQRTLVVVVADHGESFGEHEYPWEHNSELFDEVVRVPFLVRVPGEGAPTGRVGHLARTLDVTPTILSLLGLPALPGARGMALLPEPSEPPQDLLLEALCERQVQPTPFFLLGYRDLGQKLILQVRRQDGGLRMQRFAHPEDALERTSIADQDGSAVRLRDHVLQRYQALQKLRPSLPLQPVEEADLEALRALGYVGDE
jgi:arylsulfatase A-like enzyme